MIVLQSPFSAPTTMIALPNPKLGDTTRYPGEVDYKRTMSGVVFTYIRTGKQYRLNFSFENVSKIKIIELQEFIEANIAEDIKLVTWQDYIWRVKFDIDPSDFTASTRRQECTGGSTGDDPSSERYTFSLQFDATKVS